MKNMRQRIMAATAVLSVLGATAALAAPVQVGYLQIMGWDNARAEKRVNARLEGLARDFTKEAKAIAADGNMEGFGSMSMEILSEVDQYITIGVDTYRIWPHHANGESHFHAYVFDKTQGQEVSVAAILGYRAEMAPQLLALLENKLRFADPEGTEFSLEELRKLFMDKDYIPDFYFTANGTPAIYFEPGVLAPDYRGRVTIPLPELAAKQG